MIETATLILALGVPGAIIVAVLFSPWGPAALTLLSNSRIGRGVVLAAAVAWALFVAATRIRRAGRNEALAGVHQANAAAKADRERIERDVADLPADEVSEELAKWGR